MTMPTKGSFVLIIDHMAPFELVGDCIDDAENCGEDNDCSVTMCVVS